MGTNYYLYERPPCKECGRPYEAKHIGKSSAGWCFLLHVIPEEGINDLEGWEKLWYRPEAEIRDEYDVKITIQAMYSIITERPKYVKRHDESAQWYRENSAVPGPNGLARSRIDGMHCIGHGKGSWDLLVGEFS